MTVDASTLVLGIETSCDETAAALVMGTATVRTHLNHVYTKIGVSSRTALAAEATRRVSASDSTVSGDRAG